MPGNLHHLDQVVDGQPGKAQAGLFQFVTVVVVDFVAVPVPLLDRLGTIGPGRQRPLRQEYLLRTEPHGAAQLRLLVAMLDISGSGLPFGDKADDRVR